MRKIICIITAVFCLATAVCGFTGHLSSFCGGIGWAWAGLYVIFGIFQDKILEKMTKNYKEAISGYEKILKNYQETLNNCIETNDKCINTIDNYIVGKDTERN